VVNYLPNKESNKNIAISVEAGVIASTPGEVRDFVKSPIRIDSKFSKNASEKLYNIDNNKSMFRVVELINDYLNNDQIASANIDSKWISDLRWIKRKWDRISRKKKYGSNKGDFGLNVRQPELPKQRILQIIQDYNSEYNVNCELLYYGPETIVVG
jgi:hypothetical protein